MLHARRPGTLPSLGISEASRHVRFVTCSVYHVRDGKVVEQWEYGDMLGMLQQLGVISPLG
jgi:predicted ester cyclase